VPRAGRRGAMVGGGINNAHWQRYRPPQDRSETPPRQVPF